jgi:uncharacterized protein with FMN-binding domain
MRRAVLTLAGTAAGLAALLSFKTHAGAAADAAPAGPSPAASTSPAAAAASPTAATRTVTGTVANTQYGPMQVELTLAGQKITQVTVLRRTDDGAMSEQVDSFAIPKLTSETLVAQSARIDAVSGASYTSSGYIRSLQSALDQRAAAGAEPVG